MATERNVVDFKIHNISEEKFQELKAQGKIDPNAVYCTPDDSLKTSQITNCITEIPQDIKLELADGAIILKANSKLYQPNGSDVFTPIKISSDKTRSDFSAFGSGTYLLFYSQSYGGLIATNINNCVSGATDTSTATSHTWYDTTNNKIKTYSNGSYTRDDLTLPLGIFDNTYGTGVTSIKNVFNGFGYIGVSIYTLPGVKALVPNGRNDDGTLKNTTRITTNVSVYTVSSPANHEYQLAYNGTIAPFYSHMTYNAEENINYNANGTPSTWGIVGSVTFNNKKIIKLKPKATFHAVDYNDFEALSDTVETLSDTVETLSDTVEINNDNAVHKTGDETVAGTKHFIGNIKYGSLQKDSSYKDIEFRDTNGIRLGALRGQWLEDGNRRIEMFPATADGSRGSGIGMYITADGKEYNTAKTPDATSNTNHIATTAWVNSKISAGLPAGVVVPFGGKTAPSGWLRCDGSAVSRTTYAALFAAIGTLYGAGDGSTTFNLPNLTGRVPFGMIGDYIGKSTEGVLPNITGKFMIGATNNTNDYTGGILGTEGAFSSDWSASNHSLGGGSGYTTNRRAIFDASRSSALYNGAAGWYGGAKVIPASTGMTYCIKY